MQEDCGNFTGQRLKEQDGICFHVDLQANKGDAACFGVEQTNLTQCWTHQQGEYVVLEVEIAIDTVEEIETKEEVFSEVNEVKKRKNRKSFESEGLPQRKRKILSFLRLIAMTP